MTRLTEKQVDFLLKPISAKRVQELRGLSHLEAWDVRRTLIRAFGFDGFSLETLGLDLVSERETAGNRPRWTVVYRAQVRLTLLDAGGQRVTSFEDAAAGDAVNQPSLGDAHDLAMKTALSQALKRCAVNLGDQFGLSLYNNGALRPVVMKSLPHLGEPVSEAEDEPVAPEPEMQQPAADSTSRPAPEVDGRAQAHANRAAKEARGREQVRDHWATAASDGALNGVVLAPDTGAVDSLGAYLTRLAEALPSVPSAAATDNAAALDELKAAAGRVGLANFAEEFENSYGIPVDEAPVHQLREMAAILSGSSAA